MDFVQVITTVVSFVLLVCAVVVAAYAGLTRETLKTVRENNTDLKDRVAILESAEHRLTASLEANKVARTADREASEARYGALKAENEVLRSVITSADTIANIEQLLTMHHEEAKAWWSATGADLHATVEALQALRERPA